MIFTQEVSLLFTIVAFSALRLVNAHGNILTISIGDEKYPSALSDQERGSDNPPERITRWMDSNGPISVNDDALRCNHWKGKEPPASSEVASVEAGGEVTFHWTDWKEFVNKFSHHGPITAYLARCDNDDCTDYYASTDEVWFKINESGFSHMGVYSHDGKDDRVPRFATDVMALELDNKWTVQIPKDLAAGQYLLRHELVALHLADHKDGAQFYPSCTQIKVTGGGRKVPKDLSLVGFPQAYHEDDPGILFTLYDYDDKGNIIFRDLKPEDYKIPGPPMAEYKDGPAPKKEEKEEKADVEDTTTTTVQSSSTGVTQPLAAAMWAGSTNDPDADVNSDIDDEYQVDSSSRTMQKSSQLFVFVMTVFWWRFHQF